MGAGLYVLKRRAVLLIVSNGERVAAHFLQLAVEHALSPDSQKMVDSAVRYACKDWQGQKIPKLAILVGGDGVPRSGDPIFEWPFHSRTYCFEHELPPELGFLGEKELGGYLFRAARERQGFTGFGRSERDARMFDGSWSECDPFRHSSRHKRPSSRERGALSFRLTKILGLIRLIEDKGSKASAADLNFLGCLKRKASQLGYSS